ncbi:MAG: hypothetical protein MJZ94_05135 [Bacteroidales bacterium]|nr:hypothetical protein [Bacteroidales bacterium]
MKQYPKISVTHFLKKSKGDTEKGILYYYITIKRRTILKPSKIPYLLSNEEFENRVCKDAMEKERDLIVRVCELYIDDLENGKIKYDIKELADRNFKAKDEFTNGLNSYISYYYEKDIRDLLEDSLERKAKETISKRLEELFDLSMFDKRAKAKIYKTFKQMETDKQLLFYYKNLKEEDLAVFCLWDNLWYYIGDEDRGYYPHSSIIEYMSGLRNELPKILMENHITDTIIIEDYEMKINQLGIKEEFIKTVFLPIIDKITTPEYQLSITEE